MKIGGLDIATTTGLAVMEVESRKIVTQTFRAAGKKRTIDADVKQLDADRMGQAGRSFEDHLTVWLIENDISHVGIEEPLNPNVFSRKKKTNAAAEALFASRTETDSSAYSNLATYFKIHGLEFVACSVCSRLNIPVVFVNQKSWRKAFLSNGSPKDPKKEARMMCRRLNIECSSDDAAESAGVVTWLYNHLFPYGARTNDLFK